MYLIKPMEENEGSCTPRRGHRLKKLSSKASEYISQRANKNGGSVAEINTSSESEDAESREKPIVLHDNDVLSGNKIFTFQTRKKCEVLHNTGRYEPIGSKTPHAFRSRVKKDIAAKVLEENDSSEHDCSDSGSEYVASSDENSKTEPASDSDASSCSAEKKKQELDSETEQGSSSDASGCNVSPAKKCKQKLVTTKSNQTLHKAKNYMIKADDYFLSHATTKILTSNHTLDKLETPRLPQDQLQTLLSKISLRKNHTVCLSKLVKLSESDFNKWMYLMHENMNILLYGLGSKKNVLNAFHEKYLKKLPTIVVNGFFPSLSIKDVLDAFILNMLELKENPSNVYEACELIEQEFAYIRDTHAYLIVHNIDMMRSGKAQNVFARLSAVKNIHLIASIDHINAPLIWDHSKLSKFNFSWWDVTTFQLYTDETLFEGSMMVQRAGTLTLSSLRNVFLSLTSNSKGIYITLVKYQIENRKIQYYQGLAFKDLYSLCREAFLVSSDLALRAQLTEFADHKMVKFKRSPDGTEYLLIPIANTLLQEFLTEQTS